MAKINTRLINEQKLYVFAQVMKFGSITEASKQLCMTQPAVSTIIKQIEKHFLVKLFDIVGKRIRPTPAAKVLYQQWLNVRLSVENLHQEMDQFSDGISGEISIAMVSSGKYFLTRIMNVFLKDFPNVKFRCDIQRRELITQAVKNNEYEIGIITDPQHYSGISRLFLAKNPLIFIAHPSNPLAKKRRLEFKDIAKQTFIIREQSALISQTLFALFDDINDIDILFEIDSTEAIKQAVISNLGIALVPEVSVGNEIKHNILCKLPVINLNLCNDWYLICDKKLEKIRLVNNFIHYIKKEEKLFK